MPLRPVLPGATLGLVSPASSATAEEVEAGRDALRALGYRTKLMPNALARWNHLAGRDEERADDLHRAFFDPEVEAVLCVRGGYGGHRLLPRLDLDRIASTGKPLLGYSDITALHVALNRRGLPTFHAPMVTAFGKPLAPWAEQSFIAALAGTPDDQGRTAVETIVPGHAQGIVGGGCLSLLADSLGTPEAFSGRGKIVLLEDVNEKPHRLDAMLTHLLNAGALEGVVGILVGEMTGTDNLRDDTDPTWREVVTERLAPLGVPMAFGYPFGHIDAMLTLPLGVAAELDADRGTLRYLSE